MFVFIFKNIQITFFKLTRLTKEKATQFAFN